MRIARVLTRLNLGGPARQALASDPRLVARGHALCVWTGQPGPGEGDLADALAARGVEVRRLPGLVRGVAPVGDLRALARLRRELAQFDPDVVHTHASKAGLLGRRAARAVPRAARVHTFHGHVLEGYFRPALARRLAALERRLAHDTQRVVAVSHATADDLVRLGVCEEQRLVVVPPGVELDELLALPLEARGPGGERTASGALRELVRARPHAVLVGVLGRLADVKRPELALEVLQLLGPRRPELELVFVGDGDLRRLVERRIAALPADLRARAHLVGAREDVVEALADLDVVLLTSRSEGLPVALVEAGAAGRPVVATPVGGVPELVAHERTGFLGETADELAYGLDQLLEDPSLRPAMGQRARLRVSTRHSGDALADRLEALYGAVVEERRCAS